jgi:hypothetical protein
MSLCVVDYLLDELERRTGLVLTHEVVGVVLDRARRGQQRYHMGDE